MSKLDDLIKEKCPNGVKYVKLIDVLAQPISDGPHETPRLIEFGIPFLSVQAIHDGIVDFDKKVGYISEEDHEEYCRKYRPKKGDILITKAATIGRLALVETDEVFNIWSPLGGIRVNDKYNAKFLYYVLDTPSLQGAMKKAASKGSQPNLSMRKIEQFIVPFPPLEVQNEIVQILDNFAELTAELTAELSNRKKQYEYYRDLLLNFDENEQRAKYVLLGDCCKMIVGGDIPKDAFSKTESSDFHIPILSNGIGDNAIYGYTNRARVTDACVTFSARGTIGYSALREKPFFPIVRLICAVPDINILTPKYLYYVSQTLTFQVPKSGIPQLTVPMLSKYKIPIPSLEEQNRIAQVLERFDKITTDISEGLPAEIEARKKQYKYYRDKLLSFKELAPNA